MLVLSPKREEASSLQDEITQLQSEVAAQQQVVAAAEQARQDFPEDYQKVVTLGKAVPQDDDTSSLLAQLGGISRPPASSSCRSSSRPTREAAAARRAPDAAGWAEPSVENPPAESNGPARCRGRHRERRGTAPDRRRRRAGRPAGDAVRAPVPRRLLPVADFVHGLDSRVSTDDEKVLADGRLITIDGFTLKADPELGFPDLQASFAVTTYLTPETQGLTAGATPSGPRRSRRPVTGGVTAQPTSSTGTAP